MVDVGTIDTINILQAAMLAMRTAVEGLGAAGLVPDHLLIDGNR
jgi:ribonuclease HII